MTGVLLRTSGGKWMPPTTTAYVDESQLKLLLKDIPGVLWDDTAVVDEFRIPGAGSVDLLGVGLDGTITLVECKLRKNPEIRREVIGQVLAYAGGLWRMTYDDFAARYATRAGQPLLDHLEASTRQRVVDPDALRGTIQSRLATGTFRLIIAVDEITEELKFVVEWLNGHTAAGVEFLALEAEYAKDGDIEVLVPRLYGENVKKSAPVLQKQTEADVVALIKAASPDVREVLEQLLDHGHRHGHHSAPGVSGMSYWYAVDGVHTSVWAMWPKETPAPVVSLSFPSLANVSRARAVAFLNRLRENPALAAALATVSEDGLNKIPTIQVVGTLTTPTTLAHLLRAIEEVLLS